MIRGRRRSQSRKTEYPESTKDQKPRKVSKKEEERKESAKSNESCGSKRGLISISRGPDSCAESHSTPNFGSQITYNAI